MLVPDPDIRINNNFISPFYISILTDSCFQQERSQNTNILASGLNVCLSLAFCTETNAVSRFVEDDC